MTNILNPKAALFYITVFPAFINIGPSVPGWSMVLILVYVGIATLVHSAIAILGGSLRPVLENKKKTKIIRRLFSIVLLGIAVWFAWSAERRA